MDAAIYQRMCEQEEAHWWHLGRRAIIRTILSKLHLTVGSATLLEVGCGTGGNLKLLQSFGRVDAVEFDATARRLAAGKSGLQIGYCELPRIIEASEEYDVIALFDVLEHVEDDITSLRLTADKLKDGGRVVITVPAHPWLWSAHDTLHHHRRRYTRQRFMAAIEAAGLELQCVGYFNVFLFPVAVAQRGLKRLLGHSTADDKMPLPGLNRALAWLFGLERHLIGRVPLPIGLSLYAVAGKRLA